MSKRRKFERATNPFGVGMRGPGNVYVLPESVVKQVIANYAPQKDKSDMYSPGSPITPIPEITPKQGPRIWPYPTGINISGVDRSLGRTDYDIPSFQQLRRLAKLYNGITLCERVILDMIPLLELDIVPVAGLLDENEKSDKYQSEISKYKKWFEKPDKIHDYQSWLRMAWREQTQIDELYIYKQPNRGGGLYALQVVDGAWMKPLLNEQGIMPAPPFPAYQQFPYGAPGGLYTSEQFIHYQETPQSDSPYGFSRIERIILNVNIALRKQNKDLYRYTEGNIPAGIMEVPEASNWTPDQIDAYEQSWNALMAGNQQQQVRIKFTQPGMKYQAFDQPEDQMNLAQFDQFLLNITTAAYGLSMQDLAFTGDIHKSSGDSQQNVLYRRTLYPLIKVYSKIFTDVLRTDFGEERFDVVFRGFEESEDVQGLATAYSTLTNAGILGISDAGKLMKLPEDQNAAHIGRLIVGKDGPIFLDDIAAENVRAAALKAQMAGYEMAANPPDPNEQQPGGKPPASGQKAANPAPKDDEKPAMSRVVEALAGVEEQLRLLRARNITEEAYEQSTQPSPEAAEERYIAIGRGDSGHARGTAQSSAGQLATAGDDRAKAVSQEYRRWRERAIADVKAGRQQRPFQSTLIPELERDVILSDLFKCKTADDVRDAFAYARQVFDRNGERDTSPKEIAVVSGGNPHPNKSAWKLRW